MDLKELLKRTKKFGYECVDHTGFLYGDYLKNHVPVS